MRGRTALGPDFGRLWAAYSVSAAGSAIAIDAFTMTAVLVLSTGAFQVSLLAALGGVAGALLALPLGPWIEFRRKRPLMIGADVFRCAALLSVPLAFAFGALTYAQLAVVAVLVAVGQIVFVGASGAYLRTLLPPASLGEANGRFESVLWLTSAAGPPAGGLLVSAAGPVPAILVDSLSYLLSAAGIRSIRHAEPPPPTRPVAAAEPGGSAAPLDAAGRGRLREMAEGWRCIVADDLLRPLFVNTVWVSALIMAISPILALLMLRDLHFTPFEYGLSVGLPCVAGVAGARLSRRFALRGSRSVLLGAGVARVLWLPWLPLIGPGVAGLVAVTAIHTGTVFFMSLFSPVMATCRLQRPPADRVARVLTAWSIGSSVAKSLCIIAWGALAALTSPRTAITVAVVLLVASCTCLPWRRAAWRAPQERRSATPPSEEGVTARLEGANDGR